jgi:hypothetical protein
MYRRHFLKSISFGIPATAAATSLVSQKGGVLNALEALCSDSDQTRPRLRKC